LHAKKINPFINKLPPLQTMERIMFQGLQALLASPKNTPLAIQKFVKVRACVITAKLINKKSFTIAQIRHKPL
jgi:hypothetical protein